MNVALHSPVIDDVRTRILDAAEMLGDALGQEGITMRHLAASAGVHTASLYHSFDGKASLLAALETRVRERHGAALDEAFATSEDAWTRLHRICVAHVEFARRVSWRYGLAFAASALDISGCACPGADAFLELTNACLREQGGGIASNHQTALRLWIAMHGLASALARNEPAVPREPPTPREDAFVDDYVRMLLRGIGTPSGPHR